MSKQCSMELNCNDEKERFPSCVRLFNTGLQMSYLSEEVSLLADRNLG